jgi:three-Cys-motif partner protein
MASKAKYRDDPADGLPAMEVGDWSREKHDLIAKYIDGTRLMRRRWPRRTYSELFCGPGRVWYKNRGPFAPGSAVRAWIASRRDGAEFTEINVNDADQVNAAACVERLRVSGIEPHMDSMPANEAAPRILERIGRKGLHLVLLDPFSIGAMPFSLVEGFARHPKVDLIINYSVLDVQRNLLRNMRGDSDEMDRFCPGWREAIEGVHGRRAQRGRVLERWLELLKGCGATYSREMPLVRDARRRVPLYYLIFAAHHDAPVRIWGDVARDAQRDMFDD